MPERAPQAEADATPTAGPKAGKPAPARRTTAQPAEPGSGEAKPDRPALPPVTNARAAIGMPEAEAEAPEAPVEAVPPEANRREASHDRLKAWADRPEAREEPEELDDFAIIERIVPQTKPRGLLGISFGSIKIEDGDGAEAPPFPAFPEPGQDEIPAKPKKSLLSMFKREAADEDGGEAAADPERETDAAPAPAADTAPDRAELKRLRQEEKQAEKERKRAEKERRKAEKRARKEATPAATAEPVEASAESATGAEEDLPGPPPESLRQPYPELRKPILGKSRRSRPDPFPELRKPPDQRRPRPEPFPELRKPGMKPPEPPARPRKSKRKADEQTESPETQTLDSAASETAEAPTPAAPESKLPASGDPQTEQSAERSAPSAGWLSGVIRSADDAVGDVKPKLPWETPEAETAEEAEDDAASPTAEAIPGTEEADAAAADPVETEADAPIADGPPEDMESPSDTDPSSLGEEIDRRRIADVLAQAAFLDEEPPLPTGVEFDRREEIAESEETPIEAEAPDRQMPDGTKDDAALASPDGTEPDPAPTAEIEIGAADHPSAEMPAEEPAQGGYTDEHSEAETAPKKPRVRRRAGRAAGRNLPDHSPQLELELPPEEEPVPEAAEEFPHDRLLEDLVPDEEPDDTVVAGDDDIPYGMPAQHLSETEVHGRSLHEDDDAYVHEDDAWDQWETVGEDTSTSDHVDPTAEESEAAPFRQHAEPYETDIADEPRDDPYEEAPEPATEGDEADRDGEDAAAEDETPANRYADLLDPTYQPKQGFMDLGRRSILFPREDEEDETEEEAPEWSGTASTMPSFSPHTKPTSDTRWDESQYNVWGRNADTDEETGESDGDPEAPRKFVPPSWDAPASGSRANHLRPVPDEPEGEAPYEAGTESGEFDEDTLWSDDAPPDWHVESEPSAAHPENGTQPRVSAWQSRQATDFDDEFDGNEEDDAPVFFAPEPTGRPEHAASMMRTIAHSDTEYYLPPPKTPGMILLGVIGAAIGAALANTIYGRLGDVVVPHFMAILIGVQVFGGLGVFAGAMFPIPLGGRRRRARPVAIEPVPADWSPDNSDNPDEEPFGNPWRGEPQFPPQDVRSTMRPGAFD